jgi:hypothetical protein
MKAGRLGIDFVVLGLTQSTHTYVGANNHDPDGDSNGTRLTVTRP